VERVGLIGGRSEGYVADGTVIMPPSALAKLSELTDVQISDHVADRTAGLDIDGPWTFHLRNPRNPAAYNTYAGVLEFVASEGVVHLPAWVSQLLDSYSSEGRLELIMQMMKSLNLNEGDPIRLTGTVMPVKGKLVKVQAQSRDFEQVSDPRAV
jgi:ubiquitin fusion degradation protein 1